MIRIRPRRIASTAFLATLLAASNVVAFAQTTEPTLSQRLGRLTEELDTRRQELHIPGMAMAIIQGDELIYTHGFGSSDLENGTSVTPETLFGIGSTTKAFTASLIGMLIDDGRMSWDDPVTKFLPYFDLNIDSDDAEATVTIRDLLAHRTGFTRMSVLWAGNAVSREDVLRTASRAEPWSRFRGKFIYNNINYLAAGMAAGEAAGVSWDNLLAERLFIPLGMKSSSSSIDADQSAEPPSRGYLWNDEIQDYENVPTRSLDAIAPAGAVNSNVLDMAQWIRFQLGRGTLEGQVLLSEMQHKETWSNQTEISPGVDYGFGWMLRSVAGHRVVEHGGSINGFASQVALFPDADLGFVLLTNVKATPLQQLSMNLVAKALLADWPDDGETASVEENLGVYAGKYEANFATYKDQTFTVMVKSDRLVVDVPGQTVYQLEPPNGDGKWYFSLTNEVAVSFDREGDGPVVGLRMHQAGMTYELPREGFERQAEIELSTLHPFLGKYHSNAADLTFEVKISNQRLAVDVPGEMVYELFPPNEEKMWVFRPTDRVAVSFSESDGGVVTSMKLYRDGAQRLELLRVDAVEQALLPTVEEILALRQSAGNTYAGSLRIIGRIRFVHAGIEGRSTYTSDGDQHYRSDIDLGRFGWIHEGGSEDHGWIESNITPFQKLEGKYLTQAALVQALLRPVEWLQIFDTVSVTGTESMDNRKVYALQLRAGELAPIAAFVDSETGDLLRYEMSWLDPTLGIAIRTVSRYEDYRNVDGVRVAFRIVSRNEFAGETIFEVETFETDVEIDRRMFSAPE